MRILVVEDEPKIARLIRDGLADVGHEADLCADGAAAVRRATEGHYEAVVLDIMLPGRSGLEVLRELREGGNRIPVVLLTARGGLEDRIAGLNLGADDYLAKPFSIEELIARLAAVRRRLDGATPIVRHYEDLMVNLVTHEVTRAGERVELTVREYALLELLLRSPGRVFTRTELYEQVWNYHFDPGTNLVDVCVQRLRRKLDDGHAVKLIRTVRGVGYTLKGGE